MAVSAVERWRMARYDAYRWRCDLSLARKIALALGMACITGLVAQLRVPLPWTPVPITGQTFAVLLAGILLGRWWGGISMALYAGLGVLGVPWFAGWTGGMGVLAGPTGGYIVGFILATLFLGHFTDRYIKTKNFLPMLGLMLFASFVLIYVPGIIQLYLWLNLVSGKAIGLFQVLAMGLFPFIIGDAIKALIAAGIAWGAIPKEAYNGEVDKK